METKDTTKGAEAMTQREELKAIEDRLSMCAWDVTSRAPSMGEVNKCRRLRRAVGQRWDSVNRVWVDCTPADCQEAS